MIKINKILAFATLCVTIAFCVSCKKNNAESSTNEGEGDDTPTIIINGHDFVNLDLPSGTLWATCNVGAENPEDYGDYFAWGETTTKNDYSWSTYKWCDDLGAITKYNTNPDYGAVDNKVVLEMTDDAANVNWGGDCRMPTYDELMELKMKCKWTWTTQGGKTGYRVISKKDHTKSIFLPAAGYRGEDNSILVGIYGFYWSSSLDTNYTNQAYNMYFNINDCNLNYGYSRVCGRCIRPVI